MSNKTFKELIKENKESTYVVQLFQNNLEKITNIDISRI